MKKIELVTVIVLSFSQSACLAGSLLPEKHYVEYVYIDNPNDHYNEKTGDTYIHIAVKSIPFTYQDKCNGKPNPLDRTGIYIRKFVQTTSRCVMEPYDYVPDDLVIEYAFWKTDAEIRAAGLDYKQIYIIKNGHVQGEDPSAVGYNANELMRKRDADISKIPPNQWHRIVLHPKSDYATKYNYAPSLDKGWHKANNDKIIQYRIMINKDGSNKVYPIYDWKNASDGHWIP